MRAAEFEVLLAVAGRGVDEAGAGVGGDVIAREKRHVEIVALPPERVGADEARGIDICDPLGLDSGGRQHLRRKRIGKD